MAFVQADDVLRQREEFWQTVPSVKGILIFTNIEANGGGIFLRYSKYSCQVYCIVLSGTAQKLEAHRAF